MIGSESALLVEVGSTSVGVAVAERKDGKPLVISHSARTDMENTSGASTAVLDSLAANALKKSLATLSGVPRPDAIHVFLSAPWYKAVIPTVNLQSQKPLRISQGTVDKAVRDYATDHPWPTMNGERKIESMVGQAYVNDYPTAIEGILHGNTLQIDLYESATDEAFARVIEEAVRSIFPGAEVTFHSLLFTFFSVVRTFRAEESFVLVAVGGEITDIAIVTRGSIRFAGSFPVGSLSVPRALAGSGSIADAVSRLSLHARGELSDDAAQAFAPAYTKAADLWKKEYRALIAQALGEGAVSGTVFLSADPEALPWFEKMLNESAAPLPQKPIPLTPDFFRTRVSAGVNGASDAALSAAALYALPVRAA